MNKPKGLEHDLADAEAHLGESLAEIVRKADALRERTPHVPRHPADVTSLLSELAHAVEEANALRLGIWRAIAELRRNP